MTATNQCFAVSVHILTMLAASQNAAVTSEAIAASVDTNSVVIRRNLSRLRAHGLVDSRPGACGGWKLAKHPEQISLCEVFDAVNSKAVIAMHHPNADCEIGGKITQSLGKVFDKAQNALEATLGQFTIADVLRDVITLQNQGQSVV